MEKIDAKMLCDLGVCVSFAEAKRLISSMPTEKLQEKINDQLFGRKPQKSRKFAYPKIIEE